MDAKEIIIDKLNGLDVCIVDSSETEYTVRCPYCGDSSNPSHGHFGIKIDPHDTSSPMMCNCLKCGRGGLLTEDVLDDLGIYLRDEDMGSFKSYLKKISKIANRKGGIIKNEKYTVPTFITMSKNNRDKLEYLEMRLGYSLEPYIVSRKIVISIMDFMAHNEIETIGTIQPWVIKMLEDHYVGFLSSNNNVINFRCIRTGTTMRRYQKVMINPLNTSPATFYTIPTQLDILYTKPLHIHIAEGVFDILSIKKNLPPKGDNDLYFASCGYNYMSIVRYLAKIGVLTDLHAHVYADLDKTDYDHNDILRRDPISVIFSSVSLHRNAFPDEKDYGVHADHITDTFRIFPWYK